VIFIEIIQFFIHTPRFSGCWIRPKAESSASGGNRAQIRPYVRSAEELQQFKGGHPGAKANDRRRKASSEVRWHRFNLPPGNMATLQLERLTGR